MYELYKFLSFFLSVGGGGWDWTQEVGTSISS